MLFAQLQSELIKGMSILLFILFSLFGQWHFLKSIRSSLFLLLAHLSKINDHSWKQHFPLIWHPIIVNIFHGLILRSPVTNLDSYWFSLLESWQLAFPNSFQRETFPLSSYSFWPVETIELSQGHHTHTNVTTLPPKSPNVLVPIHHVSTLSDVV